MISDASDRLRRVADELEIRGLVARFADAVNRRAPADVAPLLVPECQFRVEHSDPAASPWLVGSERVVGFLTSVLEPWQWIFQAVTSGVIDIDSGAATGTWWLTETGTRLDHDVMLGGRYRDEYVHTDRGWQFASRSFHATFRQEKPILT